MEDPNRLLHYAQEDGQRRLFPRWAFLLIILLFIGGSIVRSSQTTSLDSFTYDEAYHIGAGVAYVQTGDFRLNPEHPPLTKLWVGAYVNYFGYQLTPYRAYADKEDERDFVEKDAYFTNDPFILQTRARTAMFALNGLLMLLLAAAVWRSFGPVVAVAATLYLAVDPTVAAHLPVVMTDLPIALTAGIAVLTAVKAFQEMSVLNVVLAALALGLSLSAKHSGMIVLISIALIGSFFVFARFRKDPFRLRLLRSGALAVILLGGIVTLWGFYGFRYYETPGTTDETFNRPLAEKTSDIRSWTFRNAVIVANRLYLLPRAYLWGMADTIRAGVEGRAIQVRAFGTTYYGKGPIYFFPGAVAAKLPIGLLLLSLIGIAVLVMRRLPNEELIAALAYSFFGLVFLIFLIRGSSYGGIRHALALIPVMAIFGGIAASWIMSRSIRSLSIGMGLLFVAAGASAIPQMRPWEYFNEFAGGSEGGYLYFNDEGVDLSQRVGEAARYYHAELEQKGDIPFFIYFSNSNDRKARGMDYVGRVPERDDLRFEGETISGTVMIGVNELGGDRLWWDVGKPFRDKIPAHRFGNLLVYEGTFDRPNAVLARSIFYRTIYTKIYSSEPDEQAGIQGIERSIALDDSCFFTHLELGNQYLKAGDRQKSLAAFERALEKAPRTDSIYDLIGSQIERLKTDEPIENIPALRNPGIE